MSINIKRGAIEKIGKVLFKKEIGFHLPIYRQYFTHCSFGRRPNKEKKKENKKLVRRLTKLIDFLIIKIYPFMNIGCLSENLVVNLRSVKEKTGMIIFHLSP